MQIIYDKRNSGKSTKLVQMSSKTGIPILYCGGTKTYLLGLAATLNLTIPTPISIHEATDISFRSVYVDDAECTLGKLLGLNVKAITISHEESHF